MNITAVIFPFLPTRILLTAFFTRTFSCVAPGARAPTCAD